jgi:hypothetical protein
MLSLGSLWIGFDIVAIKKVIVSKENLPIITTDGKFYLRYRIVSEDKSLLSAWSNKFEITGKTIQSIVGTENIQEPNLIATAAGMAVSWDLPGDLNKEVFDLFVKWSYDDETTYDDVWTYVGTVSSNSTYVQIAYDGTIKATHAKARVQIESLKKIASDVTAEKEYVLIAESITGVSTKQKLDGGTI